MKKSKREGLRAVLLGIEVLLISAARAGHDSPVILGEQEAVAGMLVL